MPALCEVIPAGIAGIQSQGSGREPPALRGTGHVPRPECLERFRPNLLMANAPSGLEAGLV